MVVIPNKIIYLATPRSASRSTAEALVKVGGGLQGIHHSRPETVKLLKKRSGLPTITLLRDPMHIIFSFWWGIREKQSFEYYITTTFHDCFGTKRLYPYFGVTDEYFPYSKGTKSFLEHLGLPTNVEVPQIGVRADPPDHSLIFKEYKPLVADHFPDDTHIYTRYMDETRSGK